MKAPRNLLTLVASIRDDSLLWIGALDERMLIPATGHGARATITDAVARYYS